MKTKTIFGIVFLVGFTGLLLSSFGEQVGGYMDFEQAEAEGAKAHVVGMWVDDGEPFTYNPSTNVFSFTMADEKGNVRRVHYQNPKPANFEDAEKVVIEGYPDGDEFIAENILVKCPSKYNAAQEAGMTHPDGVPTS
ncbi:MAG: cytochrome c maturation protein CcmE [Rhodothermales bacterium]|nr:cytochrome c maturation protein CcmE [Rhodothermales bacterium]MBO6779623.1 cytochrome c maturation protein CcmE [Rhodothermales bacterium]